MIKTIVGNYNLEVEDSWRLLNLQEIYLLCDTSTSSPTINLFEIADLEEFWNVKIFITDISNNASVNNIIVNAFGSDTIDSTGTSSLTLSTDGGALQLQVVSNTQWMALESTSGGGGIPTLQQVLDFNHDLVNGNNFQGTCAGAGNSGTNVIAIGTNSANSNSGYYVTASGYCSAYQNTGCSLNAFGNQSATSNSGGYVNAFGNQSAQNNTGSFVNVIGSNSGANNTGNDVNAMGFESARYNAGNLVNAMGCLSAFCNTGCSVNAIGTNSARGNTGCNINAIGSNSANSNSGNNVTASGDQSALQNTGSNVTASGYQSAYTNSGYYVTASGNRSAFGNTGCYVNAIGTSSAECNTGSNVVALGLNAGYDAGLGTGNSLSTSFIVSNNTLPSYLNYATASAAITVGAGGVAGSTYFYYDQTTNSIGAVRL